VKSTTARRAVSYSRIGGEETTALTLVGRGDD
jgi:hypothetical protein